MMHTAHKVNDFKCDIQYMHLKVELVMLESLPGTAWLISGNIYHNAFSYSASSDVLATLSTSHLCRHKLLLFHEQESVCHMDSFC